MSTTHPIEPGSMGRVIERCRNLVLAGWLPEGKTFLIEDYVPADETDDGKAYYVGSADGGGGNIAVYAENVTLDLTPQQVADRRPPSAASIVQELDLLGHFDGFRTFEWDSYGKDDGTVHVVAETDDGLPFTFKVSVSDVAISAS